MILRFCRERKQKRSIAPQDCLTSQQLFCVCRSCQTKSLLRRRRCQVPDPSRGQNPHQPVCLRTWLPRLPAYRSSVASFFTFWKSTTVLYVSAPCNQSYLVAHGFCLISPPPWCTLSLVPSPASAVSWCFSGQ